MLYLSAHAHAQSDTLIPPEFISDTDVSQGIVGLVGFATTPGVANASYRVSWPDNQPSFDIRRTSLKLERDFDLRGRPFKVFGGVGLNYIKLDDNFFAPTTSGNVLLVEPDREISTARLSAGVTLQLDAHLSIRPYLSAVLTDIDSETTVTGDADLENLAPELRAFLLDFSTKARTLAGTLDVRYDRWMEQQRLQLIGRYTYSYTSTYDEAFDFLDSSGGVNILDLEARWSGPTGKRLFGFPLRWKLLGGYTNFLDLDKESLGFRYFVEFGAGLELDLDSRPMGLFNLRNVGLNLRGLTGDDVDGWTLELTLEN